MRKLVAGAFVTMDGVMQGPGGVDEDRSGSFEHGGWVMSRFDDVLFDDINTWVQRADAFLFGRRTYEIFAAYWPHEKEPENLVVANAFNSHPKYVPTTTLDHAEWDGTTLLKGDLLAEVSKLKTAGDGELQVHGSANLLQSLLANDLVDTLRIWQFPTTLGSGKKLFDGGSIFANFALTEVKQSGLGAVLMVYERAR